ncbi:hypothetical protein SKAU_G00405570 [Synaphobranchus kaupii]|uniref:Uncharacterized protein n=1 Tax=Synaphobranchus kaupii TaxID=118154 RepID=A0A9Q1IAT2_SYNKA|nr:hypothetical protein SKAU_G00405570 [Synaphobranchus kaupii]
MHQGLDVILGRRGGASASDCVWRGRGRSFMFGPFSSRGGGQRGPSPQAFSAALPLIPSMLCEGPHSPCGP